MSRRRHFGLSEELRALGLQPPPDAEASSRRVWARIAPYLLRWERQKLVQLLADRGRGAACT